MLPNYKIFVPRTRIRYADGAYGIAKGEVLLSAPNPLRGVFDAEDKLEEARGGSFMHLDTEELPVAYKKLSRYSEFELTKFFREEKCGTLRVPETVIPHVAVACIHALRLARVLVVTRDQVQLETIQDLACEILGGLPDLTDLVPCEKTHEVSSGKYHVVLYIPHSVMPSFSGGPMVWYPRPLRRFTILSDEPLAPLDEIYAQARYGVSTLRFNEVGVVKREVFYRPIFVARSRASKNQKALTR